jgi:tetratricopeptide (TPR) repeat protein
MLAYLRAAGIGEGVGFRVSGLGNADAQDGAGPSAPHPKPYTPQFYWLALALFACALLSKSVTVSMPAVVLLLVWWKRGKVTVRDLAALAPFFLLGIGMAALTAWMERTQVGARGPEWAAITLPQRVLIAGRAIWFYVEKNLVPVQLSFIYRRWNIAGAPATWWIFPAAVVAIAAILFALRRTIGRGPAVAWLIFCGVLVPALGFIDFYPMRYSFVADHFQYLASPALIALLVAAGTVFLRRVAPRATAAPYVIAGLVLVVLSALTLMQARVYAGPLLLWDDAIKKNPTSPMLRHNYGVDLMALMDRLPPEQAAPFVDEAIRQFQEAVKLNPRHPLAWTMMGRSLLFRGRHDDALTAFGEALKLRADNVDAMIGRGRALYELKRFDDAQAAFEQALAAAQAQRGTGTIPRIIAATIYQYLGRLAVERGDLETAATQYAEAVKIAPDSALIRYEYGTVLARQAKLSEGATTQPATPATTTTQVAATMRATPATTQAATQPSERTKKLREAAAAQLAAAVEIRPGYVDAHVALANLMMDVGNIVGANTQLTAALRVSGNNVSPELKAAVERWDVEFRKREAAATRPATTRATTGPAATTTTTQRVTQ